MPERLDGLKVTWAELGCPDHIISLLTSAKLTQNPYVVSGYYFETATGGERQDSAPIRYELSRWLSEHEKEAQALLASAVTMQEVPDISAVILARGAILETTGVLVNPEARAVRVYIPEDTTPEMLDYFKKTSEHFFETLKKHNVKLRAVLAEPGAIIKGKIINPSVIGAEFLVGSRVRADAPERTLDLLGADSVALERERRSLSPRTSRAGLYGVSSSSSSMPGSSVSSTSSSTSHASQFADEMSTPKLPSIGRG